MDENLIEHNYRQFYHDMLDTTDEPLPERLGSLHSKLTVNAGMCGAGAPSAMPMAFACSVCQLLEELMAEVDDKIAKAVGQPIPATSEPAETETIAAETVEEIPKNLTALAENLGTGKDKRINWAEVAVGTRVDINWYKHTEGVFKGVGDKDRLNIQVNGVGIKPIRKKNVKLTELG